MRHLAAVAAAGALVLPAPAAPVLPAPVLPAPAKPVLSVPPAPAEGSEAEQVALVAVRAPAPPAGARDAPRVEYGWPLAPVPAVARPFEQPPFRYGRGHRGADLVGAVGQAVLAARGGVVVFAGPVAGRGVVSIEHADGLRTTYEPVTGTVARGVRVARGDPIGVLEAGHAGCPVGACLHWGVRRGVRSASEYMDPLVLLRPRHVRLLPLPDPWPG
ncbi:M23 family metallopeptidase [Pseudonocardia sp. RS010]|uniref:M23 family metallopeptidase n=1 Tax=Pseudonocardia sp. RS010 TaxID=3385979 RepID=UPI0039A0C5E0